MGPKPCRTVSVMFWSLAKRSPTGMGSRPLGAGMSYGMSCERALGAVVRLVFSDRILSNAMRSPASAAV